MPPVHRIKAEGASALEGSPVIDTIKALWFVSVVILAVGAVFFVSIPAICVFLATTYVTLLLGHSVGMHRMLIHRTFHAPRIIAYPLVWLGTMVGMGGPSKIIMIHDVRDWAQRQPICHDFFSHRRGLLRDITWQLFYRFEFDAPPQASVEKEVLCDRFYAHLDRWWALHQAGLAVGLWVWGGLAFLCWGVGLRVLLSVCGHWCVTYFCHNPGAGRWRVDGAGVQASNLRGRAFGFLTHGECWHNNHHAFPESAKVGLEEGQPDPAWSVICWLEKRGLASDVGRARCDAERDDLSEKVSSENLHIAKGSSTHRREIQSD